MWLRKQYSLLGKVKILTETLISVFQDYISTATELKTKSYIWLVYCDMKLEDKIYKTKHHLSGQSGLKLWEKHIPYSCWNVSQSDQHWLGHQSSQVWVCKTQNVQWLVGCLFLFYGITLVGSFMPNPLYTYIRYE